MTNVRILFDTCSFLGDDVKYFLKLINGNQL